MKAPPLTAESLRQATAEADPWYGPDEALGRCWQAVGGRVCRGGYVREDYRVRGLGNRTARLTTHILAWLLDHLGPMERDDLFLAYVEMRASGLQLDHRCENPACRRPSHLILCTQSENIMAGRERSHQRSQARGPVEHYEDDPALVEF